MGYDYIKVISCVFFILSDTITRMGEIFCYFPLFASSGFLAVRMKLPEGAWGKDALAFDGEGRFLGASLTLEFTSIEGTSFPNGYLLLKSNFSYSED